MTDLYGFQGFLCVLGYWFMNVTGLFIPLIILLVKFRDSEPFEMFLFRYWCNL